MHWWDRPIRICPTPWCQCPHQEEGPDDRCRECRRRPPNAERRGVTRTVLHDDAWTGEFGGCFTTLAVPEDERAAYGASLDEATNAAKGLTRAELAAWLKTTGRDVFVQEKARDLRTAAVIRQMDLWYPRSFVIEPMVVEALIEWGRALQWKVRRVNQIAKS